MTRSILLVGGTSALARALKPRLEEFARVTTAGRHGCDIELDLPDRVDFPSGFDTVINTAAHFGGQSPEAVIEAERVNALGVLEICQASARSGVQKFVQISTVFATLPRESPFAGAYSVSKRHGDEAALLYGAESSLGVLILRPAQMYGAGDAHRRHQPFLYSMVDKAQNGEEIVLFGKRDARRNFIHIDDVAHVIALAVERGLHGVYQCAHPDDVTYSRVARAAVAAFDSRSSVRFAPERPDVADNIVPFDDALYRAVGFTPEISIEAGLRMEARRRRVVA